MQRQASASATSNSLESGDGRVVILEIGMITRYRTLGN